MATEMIPINAFGSEIAIGVIMWIRSAPAFYRSKPYTLNEKSRSTPVKVSGFL